VPLMDGYSIRVTSLLGVNKKMVDSQSVYQDKDSVLLHSTKHMKCA